MVQQEEMATECKRAPGTTSYDDQGSSKKHFWLKMYFRPFYVICEIGLERFINYKNNSKNILGNFYRFYALEIETYPIHSG